MADDKVFHESFPHDFYLTKQSDGKIFTALQWAYMQIFANNTS